MKVAELIAHLRELPPDALVVVASPGYGYDVVAKPVTRTLVGPEPQTDVETGDYADPDLATELGYSSDLPSLPAVVILSQHDSL